MTSTPLGDAKNRLSELVDLAARTHERFEITVHGHLRAVLISADDLASLEDTLAILSDSDAMRALAEAEHDIAAGNLRPDELKRAKENMKGRIMLSMESTSNRMSRLGKSLISDTELLSIERIIAEIEAVDPEEIAELAGVLLAPEKVSAAGIGPSEKRFLAAVERVNPDLARAA